MSRPTNVLLSCLSYLSVLLGLASCDKKFDEYYSPPADLAPPIYQQLEQRGNFTNFLAVVEKAGYKHSLSSAGYWTIFAPTDAAFAKFFQEQGLSGVDDINQEMARQIVTYNLMYNAFTKERLVDFQSSIGWEENNAFRRRTAYYSGVTTQDIGEGEARVVANNRLGSAYNVEDNNNKYIPYFIDEYFSLRNLTAYDYNFFYPDVPYTGFNVAGAAVDEQHSLRAENGIIHMVDKVVLPLPSIDEYLASKPEYSEFKKLLDEQAVYVNSPQATEKWNKITGGTGPVYLKTFPAQLAFNPGSEYYQLEGLQMDNLGQSGSYSMFVPTNEELLAYINEVLLEHYTSLDQMDPQIIYDFLNAHMWQAPVWPSKFATTASFTGEPARFQATDVVDPKMLSNGMFYGVNKVQRSNAFHSVFGSAYLDPKYSMMSRFFQRELRGAITSPDVRYTLFLVPDQALNEQNYTYDETTNSWLFNENTSQAIPNLERIANFHVVVTFGGELDDLSGEGIIETFGGEFIRYKNNTVFAAGNQEKEDLGVAQVVGRKEASNGVVYYLDRPIMFSDQHPGLEIPKHAQFSKFYNYLKTSTVYNETTGEISGVAAGVNHTFFIPSNEAIDAAVKAGALPRFTNPAAQEDKDKIAKFIQYHILVRLALVPDGKESGAFEALYKTFDGNTTTITVNNTPGHISLTDMQGRTANVVNPQSNLLANRTVIHMIDNYLQPAE